MDPDVCNCHRLSCSDNGASLHPLALHVCAIPLWIFFLDLFLNVLRVLIMEPCYIPSLSMCVPLLFFWIDFLPEFFFACALYSDCWTSLYSLALNTCSIFFQILFLDALCIWIIELRYIPLLSMVGAGVFFFKSDIRCMHTHSFTLPLTFHGGCAIFIAPFRFGFPCAVVLWQTRPVLLSRYTWTHRHLF